MIDALWIFLGIRSNQRLACVVWCWHCWRVNKSTCMALALTSITAMVITFKRYGDRSWRMPDTTIALNTIWWWLSLNRIRVANILELCHVCFVFRNESLILIDVCFFSKVVLWKCIWKMQYQKNLLKNPMIKVCVIFFSFCKIYTNDG